MTLQFGLGKINLIESTNTSTLVFPEPGTPIGLEKEGSSTPTTPTNPLDPPAGATLFSSFDYNISNTSSSITDGILTLAGGGEAVIADSANYVNFWASKVTGYVLKFSVSAYMSGSNTGILRSCNLTNPKAIYLSFTKGNVDSIGKYCCGWHIASNYNLGFGTYSNPNTYVIDRNKWQYIKAEKVGKDFVVGIYDENANLITSKSGVIADYTSKNHTISQLGDSPANSSDEYVRGKFDLNKSYWW